MLNNESQNLFILMLIKEDFNNRFSDDIYSVLVLIWSNIFMKVSSTLLILFFEKVDNNERCWAVASGR